MAGADLAAFLNMTRSPRAFVQVCKRFGRHLYHLARYGRAMHLVNGVALVARLAKSAEDLGVRLLESAPAKRLLIEDGQVARGCDRHTAGRYDGPGESRGTRRRWLPPRQCAAPAACLPVTPPAMTTSPCRPPSCSGDGLRLGESAGGVVATDLKSRWPGHRSPRCRTATAVSATSRTSSSAASRELSGYWPVANASSTRRTVTTTMYRPCSRRCRRASKPARGWSATTASCVATALATLAPRRCRYGRTCAAATSSAAPASNNWPSPVASTQPG